MADDNSTKLPDNIDDALKKLVAPGGPDLRYPLGTSDAASVLASIPADVMLDAVRVLQNEKPPLTYDSKQDSIRGLCLEWTPTHEQAMTLLQKAWEFQNEGVEEAEMINPNNLGSQERKAFQDWAGGYKDSTKECRLIAGVILPALPQHLVSDAPANPFAIALNIGKNQQKLI